MVSALVTAPSIDTFLDNHSNNADFELLGKLAIAACLIDAEAQSLLRPRHPGEAIDLSQVEDKWLAQLFKIMTPGVKNDSIERIFENMSFVVFNYDRCIEQYLEQAISSHFRIDLGSAGRLIDAHCCIKHPYGCLGTFRGASTNIAFGESTFPVQRRLVTRFSPCRNSFSRLLKANAPRYQNKEATCASRMRGFFGVWLWRTEHGTPANRTIRRPRGPRHREGLVVQR
jgi:hypothetical protein